MKVNVIKEWGLATGRQDPAREENGKVWTPGECGSRDKEARANLADM